MAEDKDTSEQQTEALREQAVNTPHSGTSVFTHVDDQNASIHPSTIEGAENLFYGEPMTPKPQLAEIVLGPAPFGSPDPRTLGHQMVPLEDGPASAAELDGDFVKQQRQSYAGNTEENLDEMSKDELRERAEQLGVDVPSSATKSELKQAITEGQGSSSEDSDEDENEEDGGGDNEGQSYSRMNKAELLEEAKNRGLEVDETNSKAEVLEALENNDNNNG